MSKKPVSDVYLAETAARQQIQLAPEGVTAAVRVHRTRRVQVFELEARRAFIATGCLLLPDHEAHGGRSALGPLAAALERARQKPEERLLVAGHTADAALADRRAEVVRALLLGDVVSFVALATAHALVKEWQELLGWAARTRGLDCDPKGADGQVGPNTRGALARFREATGVPPGDPGAPGEADWRAFAALLDDELARLLDVGLDALAARRAKLQLVPAAAVGCGASWPCKSVSILEHTTMADERVDILAFAPADVPKLDCHANDALAAGSCDLYRKGKYRCSTCRPNEPVRGFVCFDVPGLHFDFDRSLVKPAGFPALADAKALLDDDERRQATLYGHTDTVGDDHYNKLLSERRARAVLAFFTHDLAAWEELWTTEKWDDALARDVAAAVSPAAAAQPTPAAALRAFQEERGLAATGKADGPTRLALGSAYFRAAVPEPVPETRFLLHLGGKRFMGCGELNPVGDGLDERSRRVVLLVFDPEKAPRDLPCTAGDLKPCQASCRPAPPTTQSLGDRAGFRCAVFRRLSSTCACGVRPTPRKLLFRYGLETGPDHPWSDAAKLVLTDESGKVHHEKALAEGELHGRHRVLDLEVVRGLRYRGDLREGALEVPLFGFSELHDVASEDGPTDHLAPPDRPPAAPFVEEEVPDHGLLRVRLHDRAGRLLEHASWRLTLGAEVRHGFSEDGVCSTPLPAAVPPTCTLEWGDPDEEGRLPFRTELALDAGPDNVSSMLHNLGYPSRLPLDTRVRAFQKAEKLPEKGLTPSGEVPPRTKARIVEVYRAKKKGS